MFLAQHFIHLDHLSLCHAGISYGKLDGDRTWLQYTSVCSLMSCHSLSVALPISCACPHVATDLPIRCPYRSLYFSFHSLCPRSSPLEGPTRLSLLTIMLPMLNLLSIVLHYRYCCCYLLMRRCFCGDDVARIAIAFVVHDVFGNCHLR
jgi:hypothetical protein